MKVLLPVDGSFDAKFIIDFISNYRWLRGTEFKVLHVLGESMQESEAQKESEQASELIDQLSGLIHRFVPDSTVEQEIVLGPPIYEIIELARQWGANMIVMGYRSRRSINQHLAGSVSRGVTLEAPCSVVVIRPPEERMKHIVSCCGTVEDEWLLEA